MDIPPSQPAQDPGKRKAASTVAANSHQKPRNKQPGSPKPAPATTTLPPQDSTPADLPVQATPVQVVEELLMEDMNGMIATAAYYLAERRNFAPGHELDDWLEAEQQLRR